MKLLKLTSWRRLLLYSLVLYAGISQLANAQQVAMQGWYWDYPKTGQGYNWSDTLRLKAPSLGQAGFTHVWYPPFAGNGNKSGGYDPRDLFVGPAQTSLGYLDQIKAMAAAFTSAGITPMADMVYNHRDGGALERNDAVKDYITKFASGSGQYGFKRPFPSDRYRMVIPIGGSAAEGAGTYYIKMRSRGSIFNGAKYAFHATTNKIGGSRWSPVLFPDTDLTTSADQFQYTAQLGRNYLNRINSNGDEDEFKVTVTANDFNAAGDFLIIQAINHESEYSDHLPIDIWYQPAGGGSSYNIANYLDPFSSAYKLQFQTYTNFNSLPSGRGALDWRGFRPHFTSSSPTGWSQTTSLGPQFSMQSLDYFYDYDHNIPATRDMLIDWTKWAYDDLSSKAIRMDAVKHFEPSFVAAMLNEMNRVGKNPNLVVGEWYAENADELKGWVDAVTSGLNTETRNAVPVKVFDFSLRRALKDILDNGANARQLFFSSLRDAKGMSGFNVMTFLNNHDFRSSNPSWGDALVHNNPILGYVYLLTNNQLGVPTVFYPDYYGYPKRNTTFGTDTYGFDYHPTGLSPLKTEIDQLIRVLQKYINNSPGVDYLNHYGGTGNGPSAPNQYIEGSFNRCVLYQLRAPGQTGKEVIVAINFGDTRLRVDHQIAIRNGIAPGTRFGDVLGRSAFPYAQVDNQNRIYIDLPAKSYSVWVQDAAPLSASLSTTPSNGILCAGQSATLTPSVSGGTPPYTYAFSPGVSQAAGSATGTATESGTYTVTVTDALGLTTTASATIQVNALPTAALTPGAPAVCAGQPVTLTATPAGGSYRFSGTDITTQDNTTGTITFTPTTASGTYSVVVTDANGCVSTNSATATVTINPLPQATLAASNNGELTCGQPTLTLTAGGGTSYAFSGPDLSQSGLSATAVAGQPGTFSVLVTDANGCTATAQTDVTRNTTAPVAALVKSGDISCLSPTVTLTASPADAPGYSFEGPAGATITRSGNGATVDKPGTYTVTVTAANGCSSTADVVVEGNTIIPTVDLIKSGNLSCTNPTVTLTASSDRTVTYLFAGPAVVSQSPAGSTATVNGPGSYTVTVTTAQGCSATSAPVSVTVSNSAPTVRTKNITLALDANGRAVLTPAGVDDGSADACGIPATGYHVDQTDFDCRHLGPNTVTLAVTNSQGITATATAVVTVVDDRAPTVLAQPVTVYLNAAGQAVVTPAQVNNGSSDNCGIASLNLDRTVFTCADIGSNTVTLTATDHSGQTATAQAIVTVADNVKPTVDTRNISVTLVNGSATITPAMIDNGSADACGIAFRSLDRTVFSCTDLGTNTVTLTVTDQNGNQQSKTATVTVVGTIPAPSITVSRTNGTFTGVGTESTIFLGYGAQSLNLTASNPGSAMGLTGYAWSPGSFLSATQGATVSYAPDATALGARTLTVTATNEFGCVKTASVVLTVVDARCGPDGKKVSICHTAHNNLLHENTLCIDAVAVETHLKAGCRLGDCPATTATAAPRSAQPGAAKAFAIRVAPNPSASLFRIAVEGSGDRMAELRVYDVTGRLVEVKRQIPINSLVEVGARYRSGVYLVEVTQGTERRQLRLVKIAE